MLEEHRTRWCSTAELRTGRASTRDIAVGEVDGGRTFCSCIIGGGRLFPRENVAAPPLAEAGCRIYGRGAGEGEPPQPTKAPGLSCAFRRGY